MKKYFGIIGIFITVITSPALSQDRGPTSGSLIGDISSDILHYQCNPLSTYPPTVECDFVQVLFSKKSSPEKIEDELLRVEQFLEGLANGGAEALCKQIAPMRAFYNGQTDFEIPEDWDADDFSESIERFKKMHPMAIEDTKKSIDAMQSVCEQPSRENIEKLIRIEHEKDVRTCKSFVNKYSQIYVKVSDGIWVVKSEPTGSCGVVNTSKFIADKKYGVLWEHETSKIILNKDGSLFEGMDCSNLDESKTLYSWKGAPHFLRCDYIQ